MALSCLINGHYSDTPVNDQALDIPWLVNYFVEVVNITDIIWILDDVALSVHEEQLTEHGGLAGIRDVGAV
jgi:hypothetical protein